jgi:hypothetical protein
VLDDIAQQFEFAVVFEVGNAIFIALASVVMITESGARHGSLSMK